MGIPAELLNRILDVLATSSLFAQEESRKALLIRAGLSNEVIIQFDMSGSPVDFLTILVEKLSTYGELDNGEDSLVLFLRTVQSYLGVEKRDEIDLIIDVWEKNRGKILWSHQVETYLNYLLRKWDALESPLLPPECHLSQIAIRLKLLRVSSSSQDGIKVRPGYEGKRSLIDDTIEFSDVLDKMTEFHKWLILGDPGAGKTTLLLREAARLSEMSLSLLDQRLPIWIPLAPFGQQVERVSNYSLYEYIDSVGKSLLLKDFGQEVAMLARKGRIIFLLDGLDEVLDSVRNEVLESIDAAVSINAQNTVIVTSRKVGVVTPQNYSLLEIAPIGLNDQRQLMITICGEQKTQRLLAEISGRGELQDMARNPMMLTVLALVARETESIGEYFRRHSALFKHASRMLLEGRHRKKRGVENAYNAELLLSHASLHLHGTVNDVRGEEIFSVNEIENVLETAERSWLSPWKDPRSFIENVASCSNIIYPIDALDQKYKYLHRTFREYFAALQLSKLSPIDRRGFVEKVINQQGWAEVLVLLGGLVDDVNDYLITLLSGPPDLALRTLKEVETLNPALASDVLRLRPMRLDARKQVFVQLVRKLPNKDQLVDAVWAYLKATKSDIPRVDLFFIQEVLKFCETSLSNELLGELFKYLPEVPDTLFEKCNILGKLDDYWCNVPGGVCIIGADKTDPDKRDWVPESLEVFISDFRIGKVPITNIVYEVFDPNHKYLRDFQDLVSSDELDHHPVVKISWYEAEMFCQWASQKFLDIRLPTEYEWEKAASWSIDKKLRYPWGNEWDPTRLNSWEQGPNRTTRVGAYPDGVSPCGALDMAGNVWEWCLDWYNEDFDSFSESLKNSRDPLGPESGSRRIDRGGGWYHDVGRPCTFLRAADNPSDIFSHCGFRVVSSKVMHTRGEDLFPKYRTPKVILDEIDRLKKLQDLLDSLHKEE